MNDSSGAYFSILRSDIKDLNLNSDQALLLQSIRLWLKTNYQKKQGIRKGKVWTFNVVSWAAESFNWTESKVRRIISNLCEKDILEKGNFNKHAYDKTLWITLADSFYEKFLSKIITSDQCTKKENPISKNEQPIQGSKKDSLNNYNSRQVDQEKIDENLMKKCIKNLKSLSITSNLCEVEIVNLVLELIEDVERDGIILKDHLSGGHKRIFQKAEHPLAYLASNKFFEGKKVLEWVFERNKLYKKIYLNNTGSHFENEELKKGAA